MHQFLHDFRLLDLSGNYQLANAGFFARTINTRVDLQAGGSEFKTTAALAGRHHAPSRRRITTAEVIFGSDRSIFAESTTPPTTDWVDHDLRFHEGLHRYRQQLTPATHTP